MQWTLILLAYTVTAESIPHEVHSYNLGFATEELCLIARDKVENDLKTRAITVKATCVQTSQ
ncbi:MAG: hypothetical protein WBC68_10540 [Albidovulum sp.]